MKLNENTTNFKVPTAQPILETVTKQLHKLMERKKTANNVHKNTQKRWDALVRTKK